MLGTPQLADWKLCLPKGQPGQSVRDLEEGLAGGFKELFAQYDPSV